MSRRPGFVLEVDKSTPPTLFWHGEGFTLETLPEGSRVIYAPEPMKPIEDPYRAIRHALLHPLGDSDPLPALLRPGMKLTICFDDVSLPLPPMEAPDARQMVIETVLDMAAEAGVDDVVLVAALALHRRMTEDELRHALGDRIYDAFAPHGLLTQHDAEDPDNLIHLGETDQGEEVEINKRAATSTTSSTPASAAMSSTVSITIWRASGASIGGSGSEMSSKQMVSFMPGRSSAGSGSLSPSGCNNASRTARYGSSIGFTGSGA